MDSKILGFVFIIVGFVIILANLLLKKFLENIPLFKNSILVLLVGAVLVFAGLLFMKGSKPTQRHEVPIYDKHGKEVVGYRRMK